MPSRSSRSSATRARDELIAMLEDDHKQAKKAWRDFEKLDLPEDADAALALVQRTCAELEVHTTLEEELFYPAARRALHDQALIDEAEVEHMTARMLIEQLKDMEADDEKFPATFKVLGEYLKHHIREEEREMFEQVGRARLDWTGLLDEMRERREELLAEKGLAQAGAPEAGREARTQAGGPA